MKHIYSLLLTFFIGSFAQSQIVNIPDANFKDALINYPFRIIDTNGDGEIQVSEAVAYDGTINVYGKNISDMTGIEAFVNIIELSCEDNLLTSLDVTQNTQLERLEFWDNQITSIDLSQNLLLGGLLISRNLLTELDVSANVGLIELWADDNMFTTLDLTSHPLLDVLFCEGNMIETLDLSQNSLLTYFTCDDNGLTELLLPETSILEYFVGTNNNLTSIDFSNQQLLVGATLSNNPLTTLDFSSNPLIESLRLENMTLLTSLLLKNGSSLDANSLFIENTENLEFICADQFEIVQLKNELASFGYNDVVINGYCTFVPGGKLSYVQGFSYVDFDADGCGVGDPVYPYLKYLVSNGTTQEYFFNDANGFFEIPLPEGNYTITPILENLDYFTISPSFVNLELPMTINPIILDFCINSEEIFNDLEIYIIPLEQARPGFDVDYKMIYKNKGSIPLSGSVEFNFDGNYVTYQSASQTPDSQTVNALTWNYASLQPLESREITVTVNLNTPTDTNFPLNGGDELGFQSIINPIPNDANEEDNITFIKHRVVNSFDPNDMTCLEGETIEPEMVGKFVHYMVRFENTGTADAINVVVNDIIDTTMFDVSSIIPLKSSHDFVTRITNNNELEFIFENINLPFDDANNDGYVVFKIKTLPTLQLGDVFTNDAEIYFDYNAPILTNDFLTTVEEALSVSEFASNGMKMYPNPVRNQLNIESRSVIHSATIYDVNGRLLKSVVFTDHDLNQIIDLNGLSSGIYFVRIFTDEGTVAERIIKE